MKEIVTLVDEYDNVIGDNNRDQLSDNDRWRVVEIWVTNSDGKVLMAKRSSQKNHEPDLWEPGASGTVIHPESYEISAHRELEEELGLQAKKLELEKVIFYEKPFGKRACGLFRVVIDKSQSIRWQEEEVVKVKWLSVEELKANYKDHPDRYVSELNLFLEYFTK